ncbi:dehydrodolichyl diphosphate synthase complex subunit nus1 isoform X2 [Hydra vulgaris]|uniref:ditrans,polycis-polyprenyl diphosphate synthase [(2E,6E)-farnesyldiphosphate specific] n=1 Tax=Hydra vulgaris TaxID=6087 RepID=A0ABM4BJ10_HYDVU
MQSKEFDESNSQKLIKYGSNIVFKYALTGIQNLFHLWVLVYTFLAELKKFYLSSTRRISGGLSYDYLQYDISNLTKLPRHLSFVVNEDIYTNSCEIANLLCWTIAMGIPYITLYDRHGIFKAGEKQLGKLINKKVIEFFGQERSQEISIILKDSSNTYKNGITFPRRFCIQILCEEDGRTDIALTAKSIAKMYTQKKLDLLNIDLNYIDKSLNAIKNIPDPDMAIQFGPVYSLMGFLPWQTRLTEIFHVQTYKNISYDIFRQCLVKYSKCDQRLGK